MVVLPTQARAEATAVQARGQARVREPVVVAAVAVAVARPAWARAQGAAAACACACMAAAFCLLVSGCLVSDSSGGWPRREPARGSQAATKDDSPIVMSDDSYAGRDVLRRLGLERILVLRVDRARERSRGLEEDAGGLGVPLEFLSATDGLTNPDFRSRVWPSHLPRSTCSNLISAIFDTHWRAWSRVASIGGATLILEDDVRLPPDFLELLKVRMEELPKTYHMAFCGCAIRKDNGTVSFAEHVSRISNRLQPSVLLGFWGYIISQKGARRVLHIVERERGQGPRAFEPVDLYLSRRHLEIQDVFFFEPPKYLAAEFELNPDRHHVVESHRQVGIVRLGRDVPSLNNPPEEAAETNEISNALQKSAELGQAGKMLESYMVCNAALMIMRTYSCWGAAPLLSNAGLSLLQLLEVGAEQGIVASGAGAANRTLSLALEALASSIRYNGGTWKEWQNLKEFPGWVRSSLWKRSNLGLPEVEPPLGWNRRVRLLGGHWLEPKTLVLTEPQPNTDVSASASLLGNFAN